MSGIKKAFKRVFSKPKKPKPQPVAPVVDVEAIRKEAENKGRRGRASQLLGGNRGSRLTGAGGIEDGQGTAKKKLLGQ
jgi:hypothetical protein